MSMAESQKWAEITQKVKIPASPRGKLVYEDGIPMESDWHRAAMNLLIEIIVYLWRGRKDYYVGGNMFIYFDPDQVRTRNFRGPDFFVVKGVRDNTRWREAWVLWEEEGLGPNVVVELTSQSTLTEDTGPKKDIYEQILRVPEYFCYDPETETLLGWRLQGGHYVDLQANEKGWLWSEELETWVGTWYGEFLGRPNLWLRFFGRDENLLLTGQEAEAEARRSAEAELERLKAQLKALGHDDLNQ